MKTAGSTFDPTESFTGGADEWQLVLYVGDNAGLASPAISSVERFCNTRLAGRYSLEVLPIRDNVERASDDLVPALPALVRKSPGPIRRVVGNLTKQQYIAVGLGLTPERDASF